MNRHNILPRTLIATAAATAVAASPALAKPADDVPRSLTEARTSSLAGTTTPKQDIRMPDQQAPAPDVQPGQPTWPVDPESLSKPVVAAEPTDGGGGESIWLVLGIGLGAAGLVAGSAAGVARRSKVRARRVAV